MRKKSLYKIANIIRKSYWYIFRPQTTGVKMLIQHEGNILMIQNAYGKQQWTFPGGGVHRGESFEKAALREVQEEVGITITSTTYIGSFFTTKEYAHDTVHCFLGSVANTTFVIDSEEIEIAKWFLSDSLPENISSAAKKVLELYA